MTDLYRRLTLALCSLVCAHLLYRYSCEVSHCRAEELERQQFADSFTCTDDSHRAKFAHYSSCDAVEHKLRESFWPMCGLNRLMVNNFAIHGLLAIWSYRIFLAVVGLSSLGLYLFLKRGNHPISINLEGLLPHQKIKHQ